MTATRESLLAWVHACGVAALDAVFREQAAAVAGPKGQHQAGRTHHHWGTTPTELTLGGRRIQVPRPRVRGRAGGEGRSTVSGSHRTLSETFVPSSSRTRSLYCDPG
jgi:hypothetical protein